MKSQSKSPVLKLEPQTHKRALEVLQLVKDYNANGYIKCTARQAEIVSDCYREMTGLNLNPSCCIKDGLEVLTAYFKDQEQKKAAAIKKEQAKRKTTTKPKARTKKKPTPRKHGK